MDNFSGLSDEIKECVRLFLRQTFQTKALQKQTIDFTDSLREQLQIMVRYERCEATLIQAQKVIYLRLHWVKDYLESLEKRLDENP